MHIIEGYRLSPQQNAEWVRVRADGAVHCSQCALLVTGALDVDRLDLAVRAVVQRHEILRTTYGRLAGVEGALQVIVEDAGIHLEIRDSADDESECLERAM